MNATGTSWFDWGSFDWARFERDRARVIKGFWPKVRRTLGRVTFLREAVAAYFCARDPLTPWHVKAAILGALAYFIMPLDALPDFILLLGYTDDATVFWAVYRTIQPHITEAHRAKARTFLEGIAEDA